MCVQPKPVDHCGFAAAESQRVGTDAPKGSNGVGDCGIQLCYHMCNEWCAEKGITWLDWWRGGWVVCWGWGLAEMHDVHVPDADWDLKCGASYQGVRHQGIGKLDQWTVVLLHGLQALERERVLETGQLGL